MAFNNDAARKHPPTNQGINTFPAGDSRWKTYAILCERINRSWKAYTKKLETEIANHLYNISDLQIHNAGLSSLVVSMMRTQGLMENQADAATEIATIKSHPEYQSGIKRFYDAMNTHHSNKSSDPLPCPHHQQQE